jgi:phage terminase small subunit
MARKPPAPSGLSTGAKKVWTKTLENYELRQDELALLEHYCMELTIADNLQAALVDAPLMVKASHGGEQINPIYPELRMHRQTAMSLWKALKLPDLEAGEEEVPEDERVVPMSREDSARKAANARWGKRG